MSRNKRKELIQIIEKKRNSKVITYITSDRSGLSAPIAPDVVSIIHQHILELKEEDGQKLDLFVYSRGGQSDVPWTIVSMFREYSQKGSFSVLIPYRAHSAATVIALGADEIVMTKKAELGPIDITMTSGPYNPTEKDSNSRLPISVEDVKGYFSLLEEVGCGRPDEKMKGFELLTKNVHPLALGNVSRLLEETKLVALRLLSTRAEPFSEDENHEIIKRISSEIYSHNHTINRTEAMKYIGLKQVKNAEDFEIDDELWALYKEYNKMFDLENPFNPEEYLISNNLEEHTWNDLNLACIESSERVDTCKKSLTIRKIRQIPPEITLNLSNVNIPAIKIPNLPTNVKPEEINIIIKQIVGSVAQQSLNDMIKIAVEQLIKSMPQSGFEQLSLSAGWKEGK